MTFLAFITAALVRATPLIIIGLGFALALRAGALNIGAEGQFLAGAMAATWAALHAGALPMPVAIGVTWLAAVAAGAAWMLVPVVLRLRYGVLEVISTLLLNFVAVALVSYMVQGPLQEPTHVYPQSAAIPMNARLPFLPGTRIHVGFVVAVLLAGLLWWYFNRTVGGFRLLAVGEGPRAARVSGRIRVDRTIGVALLVSGAIAGLAGAVEVGGVSYALYQNLSPGYGFTAIAVALLARLDPIRIIASGLFFGALEAWAAVLPRDAGIPAVTVYVIEAAVILALVLLDARRRARLARALG